MENTKKSQENVREKEGKQRKVKELEFQGERKTRKQKRVETQLSSDTILLE